MTYATDEKSVAGSAPIELYEFVAPNTTWRYTSHDVDVTFDSDVYTAIAMIRSSVVRAGQTDPPEFVVEMPASAAIIGVFVPGPAPRSLELTVTSVQGANSIQLWNGVVTGFSIEGTLAKLRSPSLLDDPLSTQVPSVSFQRSCTHVLFDSRCSMVRTTYDLATTASSVSGKTIVVASVGGAVNHYYRTGEIVRDADGERRMVTSQVGTTLKIDRPFGSLVATDAVTLYAGCDHKATTCRDKFANILNFGGHQEIPAVNPFTDGLRGGT